MKENNLLSSAFATMLIGNMFGISDLDKARDTTRKVLTDDGELAKLLNMDENSIKMAVNNMEKAIKEQNICMDQL